MVQCIASNIATEDKRDTKGYYIEEKFKTIHIDNFGKFIPNKARIKYANHRIKLKNSNEDKLPE